jgi:hypothetical protein
LKIISTTLRFFLLVVVLSGCSSEPSAPSLEAPTPALSSSGLFIETDAVRSLPVEPHISRSQLVKVNFSLLLDESGQPRNIKEIALNLFPDVIYTGVIEKIEQNGDGFSWVGYLKDVEFSELTMVYTSGVFIGHFASPLGVYEVSFLETDLYRAIMIDQSQFTGGEG